MGRKPKATDYVSNARLRELIIQYNDLNPNDNGDWLPKFEKTMKTKGKWEAVKSWVTLRKKKYAQPRKYTPEFAMVSKELFESIYKIAKGRVSCFSGIPVDEREDVIQDCMLAVVQYINRYREDLNTSAFAYVTQILSNALKLHMGQENDSMWCRQPWHDVSDQCIALMYGVEEASDDYET